MNIVIIVGLFLFVILSIVFIVLGLYFGGVFGQGESTDPSTEPSTDPSTDPSTTSSTPTSPSTSTTPTLKVVPSNIDAVFGWQGPHENPGLKDQTEEDCRQAALRDSKYVAYGYRTSEHPEERWKNTCFLYTSGFGPFKGTPDDKAHKTGCLRPGEKVEWGCKTVPPIDAVFGWQGPHENPGLKNQTEEDCRQAALRDSKYVAYGYRTQEHPEERWKNTCFLYTSGFGPFKGNPDDKAHKTGCLRPGEKVEWGCKTQAPTTQ